MSRFACTIVFAGFALGVLLGGCSKRSSGDSALLSESTQEVAGISWQLPKGWTLEGERPMRVATYGIPAGTDSTEAAECAVFYFGSDQGGDVDMNIQRWAGQFETTHPTERSSRDVNGIKVTEVKIAGTYLSPGGPMMMSQGRKDNYGLAGAIIEAPEGMVFFKLTGPASVVEKATAALETMVSSIRKK
jgi:hypothetical protein